MLQTVFDQNDVASIIAGTGAKSSPYPSSFQHGYHILNLSGALINVRDDGDTLLAVIPPFVDATGTIVTGSRHLVLSVDASMPVGSSTAFPSSMWKVYMELNPDALPITRTPLASGISGTIDQTQYGMGFFLMEGHTLTYNDIGGSSGQPGHIQQYSAWLNCTFNNVPVGKNAAATGWLQLKDAHNNVVTLCAWELHTPVNSSAAVQNLYASWSITQQCTPALNCHVLFKPGDIVQPGVQTVDQATFGIVPQGGLLLWNYN